MRRPIEDLHFAVLETETTGYYPEHDRIVEIAIRRIDSAGRVLDDYSTLVNPLDDLGLAVRRGITAEMIQGAPTFAETWPDIRLRLGGAVWAGHNIAFRARFLQEEAERLGEPEPAAPMLCTMGLCRHFGPSVASHRLEWLCERLGIPVSGETSASALAEATARVLVCLLGAARERGRTCIEDLGDLGATTCRVPLLAWPDLPFAPPRRVWPRETARSARVTPGESFISSLVSNLKPAGDHPVPNDRIGFYLHVLDRVLKDRVIDDGEAAELTALAHEWELTRKDARRAHEIYLGMLVATALEDHKLSQAERRDLERVSRLLDVPPEVTEAMLAGGLGRDEPQ